MKTDLKLIKNDKFEEKELDEEENKVVDLRLVPGGKEPTDPGNWLSELEEGTVFLIRDKHTADFNLGLFHLIKKTDKSVLLFTNVNTEIYTYVDPRRFCNKYVLHEILGKIEKEKEINIPKEDQ